MHDTDTSRYDTERIGADFDWRGCVQGVNEGDCVNQEKYDIEFVTDEVIC